VEYRSSGTGGRFNHFGGDIVSNVESSHGVQLSGGSTGGLIQPVGDDANISISLVGKGTGGVVIGNSSQSVTLGAGSAFKGFYTSTFSADIAAISSGQVLQVSLSTSIAILATMQPGDLVMVEGVVSPAVVALAGYRTSTAASSKVSLAIINPGSTASSTGNIQGVIAFADLT
jgi:hypothetical protein